MTNRQFLIANFLKKIGFHKKNKRLTDASAELHLLREAEDVLGTLVWRNIEHIDQFKLAYWELHKLHEEKEELIEKIQTIQDKIESIKQSKIDAFSSSVRANGEDLEAKLEEQNERVKMLQDEAADIARVGKNIRNLYDGLILKLQTLEGNKASQEEIDAEKQNIAKLKEKFTNLKKKKLLCQKNLNQQQAILEQITEDIKKSRSNLTEDAAKTYNITAKANKAISAYRLKLGMIESSILKHYGNIGKEISKEAEFNAECKKAVGKHLPLCNVIRALRQSIQYNHTLAGR